MARQESIHPFVGRIGDLIYYKRNGKYFVRKAGSPSKEKIKNAPEFEKTRKLNCEFGGCANAGHDLRMALASLLPNHSDKDITARLNGLFSKVIKKGKGEVGSRMIEIKKNRELLKDFQFNKAVSFDRVFYEPLKFVLHKEKKQIEVFVENIHGSSSFCKMSGASHFRLILTVLAFSDLHYNKKAERYKPISNFAHGKLEVVFSDCLSIREKHKDLSIKTLLPGKEILPDTVGLVVIVGIEIFKEENGIMYPLAGKGCMKVGEVF